MTQPKQRQVTGLAIFAMAASHLLLLSVIQIENYLLYARSGEQETWQTLLDIARLTLFQGEGFITIAGLATLIIIMGRSRLGLGFAFFLVISSNFYLVVDQIGFKLFFDHFHPAMLEGSQHLGALISSGIAELDRVFFFNLVLFFLSSLFVARAFFAAPANPTKLGHLYRSPAAIIAMAAIILIDALFPVAENLANTHHHPFYNLGVAWMDNVAKAHQPTTISAADAATLDLNRLRFGNSQANTNADEALQAWLNGFEKKPRNVIWLVLESVGSKQLLPDGHLDATVTPNLANLAQHALIFNEIYSPYPGTVRSHLAMESGGRLLTWGSVFDELTYPYRGPTLARQFAEQGYDTALFSAQKLDFENMNGFYKHAGYATYFDFGESDAAFQQANTLQSWGAKEEAILDKAFAWLSARQSAKPFLLRYFSIATHHPYDTPTDFDKPFAPDTPKSSYLNALRYTDKAIGEFIDKLKTLPQYADTLIVISGDHGEAFGEYHAQNRLHKNFLYEENVKNFLIVANPTLLPTPLTIPRVGSVGDIMPTLLALNGLPPADAPGQDLTSAQFQPRLAYFYKNAFPDQWGLRDGNWKYISHQHAGKSELYDLAVDAHEQTNLAERYPERLALYRQLVSAWFTRTNDEFVARLDGFSYPGGKAMSIAELASAGPKYIAVGYNAKESSDAKERFQKAATLNPDEQVVVWTRWVSYPQDKVIRYRWTSPSGVHSMFDFDVKSEWVTTTVLNNAPRPLENGEWRVELLDGDRALISASFVVDSKTPLSRQPSEALAASQIALGKYASGSDKQAQFSASAEFAPDDDIAIWTQWTPRHYDRRIDYVWRAPSGKEIKYYFDVQRGWDQTWVKRGDDPQKESGQWQVSLYEDNRLLASAPFTITAGKRPR